LRKPVHPLSHLEIKPQAEKKKADMKMRNAHRSTLIGNPVSAVILDRYQSDGLLAFLAAVLFTGLVSAVALRWHLHGRKWVWAAKV
jgi:hypothetical protein